MNKMLIFIAFAVLTTAAQGQEIWVARYNGPANLDDDATAIAVDGSGNVYVTGASYGSGTFDDYATIKYNSSGDTMWVRRYNGPADTSDYASAIAVDGDGNVYVTGGSSGSGTYDDYTTIKYNSSGDTVWVRRYNGPGNDWDYARAIAVDWSGYVYVTGQSCGAGTWDDYATIKYNSVGDTVWVRRYNGPGNYNDGAYAIAVDWSGYVYVTGFSEGSGDNDDYTTIKYNSAGDTVWVRRYNGPGNEHDYARAIAVDGSGDVYVTGESYGSGTYYDYTTIKYNSSGVEQWVRSYNGPGNDNDYASAIALDGNGNVYVTGESGGSGTSYDYTTIKYNSSGDTMWVRRYNGPGNSEDYAYAIALDGSGNVYVTGESYGSGTYYDYATIKYSCEGVEERDERLEIGDWRLEAYPNPLTKLTEIKYELPKSAYVKIELYNLAGRAVATVQEGEQSAGMQVCRLKGNEISGSGIYFIKFEAGSYRTTKKVTVIR